jgi:membrane protease YdiL (CAAX protease family)
MILPLVFVYAVTRAFWVSTEQPWFWRGPEWVEGAVKIGLWVIPTMLLVMLLRRGSWRTAAAYLGLTQPGWRGPMFAAAATLPMVVFLTVSPVFLNPASLVSAVLLGPFAEEVLFRGYLFHQLQRQAKWPVPWAILGSGVVFALAHATIGPPTLATIVGGCLFAWMTWRWQSLWPAIALHAAVNFWWDIAPVAVHSPLAPLGHGIALAIAAAITWRFTVRIEPSRPIAVASGHTCS